MKAKAILTAIKSTDPNVAEILDEEPFVGVGVAVFAWNEAATVLNSAL